MGKGTYRDILPVCALALGGLLIARKGAIKFNRNVLALLLLGAGFLVDGFLMATNAIPGGFHRVIMWSMVLVLAINCLPLERHRINGGLHSSLILLCLTAFVVVQAFAVAAQINTIPRPVKLTGLFSNMHYLAQFSIITIPLIIFLIISGRGLLRFGLSLLLAGDLWLLMKSQSRPGFLAIILAALVILPLLSFKRGLLALATLIVLIGGLYGSDGFGFATRINDLIEHFFQEERLLIWRETLAMQSQSTLAEWWFGHGLGQFYWDYQKVSSFRRTDDFSSPHSYILELLYGHGIIGLSVFTLAVGYFLLSLYRTVNRTHDPGWHQFGIMLTSMAVADLLFGFLTMPFFSRHNLYPLILILGTGIWYINTSNASGSKR